MVMEKLLKTNWQMVLYCNTIAVFQRFASLYSFFATMHIIINLHFITADRETAVLVHSDTEMSVYNMHDCFFFFIYLIF